MKQPAPPVYPDRLIVLVLVTVIDYSNDRASGHGSLQDREAGYEHDGEQGSTALRARLALP